jgi:hypothetical protein
MAEDKKLNIYKQNSQKKVEEFDLNIVVQGYDKVYKMLR